MTRLRCRVAELCTSRSRFVQVVASPHLHGSKYTDHVYPLASEKNRRLRKDSEYAISLLVTLSYEIFVQHRSDIDRLKLEIVRYQKAHSDVLDKFEKQKKQTDTLEQRIADLKKEKASDQSEIKDLKVKLRMSEHERSQLGSRHEKALSMEKKKREVAERRLEELAGKGEEEAKKVKDGQKALEDQLKAASNEIRQLQVLLVERDANAASNEATFNDARQTQRNLMMDVADAYSDIFHSTVPNSMHSHTKEQMNALHLRCLKLQRKLANSEAQVLELANLIRQKRDENAILSQQLLDLEDENQFCWRQISQPIIFPIPDDITSLQDVLHGLLSTESAMRQDRTEIQLQSVSLSESLYHLKCFELLEECVIADVELRLAKIDAQQTTADMTAASTTNEVLKEELQHAQQECSVANNLLNAANQLADDLAVSANVMRDQLRQLEAKTTKDEEARQASLKKANDIIQRLSVTVQMAQMAEEGLRVEIDQ